MSTHRTLPEVCTSPCHAAAVTMLASTRTTLPEVFAFLCQVATVKMRASTRGVLPDVFDPLGHAGTVRLLPSTRRVLPGVPAQTRKFHVATFRRHCHHRRALKLAVKQYMRLRCGLLYSIIVPLHQNMC